MLVLVTLSEMDIKLLPMLHLWSVNIIPALLQYVRERVKADMMENMRSSMACEGRNERFDPKHWSSGLHLLSINNLTPKDLQAPQTHSAAAAPRNRRLDGWVMNKGSHTIQLHTHPSQKNWCPCLAGQFTVRLNVQLHAACLCLYISSRVTRPSWTLTYILLWGNIKKADPSGQINLKIISMTSKDQRYIKWIIVTICHTF